MSANDSYNQKEKIDARNKSLTHAVNILTSNRKDATCVRYDYLAEVKEYIRAEGDSEDSRWADLLNDDAIKLWQDFHVSCVGKRLPRDLKVCYLAGPEPENDFKVLMRLGVHPNNIWAFESDSKIYSKALSNCRSSFGIFPRLFNISIDKYLEQTPNKFDIIYIDACGPLPSKQQHTLRTITTALKYHRLRTPGVLITTFSSPDISNRDELEKYGYLVSNYLYPKEFIEGYWDSRHKTTNALEGPICYDYRPDEDKSFFEEVSNNFHYYYGQFITRQLFDLGLVVIPWLRFVNSDYWKLFSRASQQQIKEIALGMRTFDRDYKGGDVISEAGMFPLQWSLSAILGKDFTNDTVNFPTPNPAYKKFYKHWISELDGFPSPSIKAISAIESRDVLWTKRRLLSDSFYAAVGKSTYGNLMHQFCDLPMYTLGFDCLIGQLAYPVHYNLSQTRRWMYKAKVNTMFTDTIVFDECRYVYDWMPGIDQILDGFNRIPVQLSYRFALDGIFKHLRWYNTEYFNGATIVDQYQPGFEAKELLPRVTIVTDKT